MAIAYDTTGTGGTSAPASSITYNHTVASTQPGLIVQVWVGDTVSSYTLTGITYAGAGATSVFNNAVTGGRIYAMFKKTAPATGSNNVTVSFSGAVWGGANSTSYTGVDQTNLEDTSVYTTATGNLTLTVTTSADDCWLVGGAGNTIVGIPGAGTGTTSRGTADNLRFGDSNASVGTAGAGKSMQFTAASGTTAGGMIALKPAAGASGPANLKSLDTNVKANIKSYNTNVLANIKSIDTNA